MSNPKTGRTLPDYEASPLRPGEDAPMEGSRSLPQAPGFGAVFRPPPAPVDETAGTGRAMASDKPFKPFPFALRKGVSGARIHSGHFYYCISGIGNPVVVHIDDLATFNGEGEGICSSQYLTAELAWWGDIHLVWRTNDTTKEVVGAHFSPTDGYEDVYDPPPPPPAFPYTDYHLFIGSVPEGGVIAQEVGGDVWWYGGSEAVEYTGRYGIEVTGTEIDFDAENIGDGDAEIYVDGLPNPLDDQAQFRTISGRGEYDEEIAGISEQIRVVVPTVEAGDPPAQVPGPLVRVIGNGKVGKIEIIPDGESAVDWLEWIDGLVATDGTLTLYARTFKVCVNGAATDIQFLCLTPP